MMKRIMSFLVSVVFAGVIVLDNPINLIALSEESEGDVEDELYTIYTERDNETVEIKTNLELDSISGYTEKVISENVENNTGILNEDVEAGLNNAGILDSEIENFTDEEVANLEEAKEICVVSGYYELDEVSDECMRLDDSEIEDYYREYYNDNYSVDKEENESPTENSDNKMNFVEKALKLAGLIPETVYAKKYSDGDTRTTSGGKFKHTVYLCDKESIDGRRTAFFSYTMEWLEIPKYNKQDYFGIEICGSVVKPGQNPFGLSYELKCKKDTYIYEGGKSRKVLSGANITKKMNEKHLHYKSVNNKTVMAYYQDLPGDGGGTELDKPFEFYPTVKCYEYRYYDVIMKMSGYTCMINRAVDQFDINTQYFHMQSNNPEFEITSISLGLPLNVSVTLKNSEGNDYYKQLAGDLNAKIDVNIYK